MHRWPQLPGGQWAPAHSPLTLLCQSASVKPALVDGTCLQVGPHLVRPRALLAFLLPETLPTENPSWAPKVRASPHLPTNASF